MEQAAFVLQVWMQARLEEETPSSSDVQQLCPWLTRVAWKAPFATVYHKGRQAISAQVRKRLQKLPTAAATGS